MNKKLNIALIVVWSCILVLFVAVLVYSIQSQGSALNFIKEEYTFDADQINNIEIDLSSEDVEFIPTQEKEIKVIYNFNNYVQKNEKPIVKQTDDILKVYKTDAKVNFGLEINERQSKLEVYLPQNYNKDIACELSSGNIHIANVAMKNIATHQSSGDLNIEGLVANNLNIEQSSGNAKVKNLMCSTLERNSSSGDTQIIEAKINTAHIYSTSGDIRCEKIEAIQLKSKSSSGVEEILGGNIDEICCSSTSGNVNIEGQYKQVIVESSSGNSKFEFKTMPHTIKVYKTSGDTTLYLNENAQFNLGYNTTSGDFNSQFDLKESFKEKNHHINASCGTSQNNIIVKSSSGNLKLKQKLS